jgi:predicted PurR-regulated permease PerM
MVIPELISSVSGFTDKFPYYLSNLTAKVSNFLEKSDYMNDNIRSSLEEAFTNIQKSIFEWFTKIDDFAGDIKDWLASVIGGVKNIGIGFVISIYILYGKEEFIAQVRKLMYAILPEGACKTILTFGIKCNTVFSDFIVGKAVDSLIIGILCFIGLTIMDMPYVVLISLVIGITNMIPFFGPFIGAIPSALLILLSEPDKTIPFIIFVIVLQQIDGNIIGPKILGDKLGLSTFWIMFAILVFGGLFDFFGMLIGVPVFTLLYSLVSSFIHNRLESKDLPLDKRYYSNMNVTEEDCNFPTKVDYSDEDIDESVIPKRSTAIANKVKAKLNLNTSEAVDRLRDKFSKKK